jgi:hypothetical protein
MPKKASLTMMRSSAPGLRDAEAKRQSAAFCSGTATKVCRSKQGWPVYRQSGAPRSTHGNASAGSTELRQILPRSKFRNAAGPPVKPSIVRTWPADILTIDGQIQKTFHILIPRWRLTGSEALSASIKSSPAWRRDVPQSVEELAWPAKAWTLIDQLAISTV